MTLALIRRDFAFLCRKTTADLQQIDCNAYGKITAGCQQIVSNFYLAAPHFFDGRIGVRAEKIRDPREGAGLSKIFLKDSPGATHRRVC